MEPRRLTSGTIGRTLTVVTLVAIGVSGCGDDAGRYGSSGDVLAVMDAWARSSPAGVSDGVAYMTVQSPVDDQLIGVSVPADVAAKVELHETMVATEDTTASMTMRQITAVVLPAGELVVFGPGGLHVMLLDLAQPLESGSSFELTLTFAAAAATTVTVAVRDEAP